MKNNEFLQESLGLIDDELITDAKSIKKRESKKNHRFLIIAACVAVLATLPIGFLIANRDQSPTVETENTDANNTISQTEDENREIWVDNRKYKDGIDAYGEEFAIEWSWEYLDIYEKYLYIDRKIEKGTYYTIIHSKISESLIDSHLGTTTAYGYDYSDGTEKREVSCEIYSIKGADSSKVIAAKLDGTDDYISYKYFSREYLPPETLGELIVENDLSNKIKFTVFSKNQNNEIFNLSEDISKQIWTLLQERSDAVFVEDDPINDSILNKIDFKNVISFGVSSDELGFRNKSFAIFGTGYAFTNIEEYGYHFNIGEETAQEIIKLATDNAKPAAEEDLNNKKWVAGTITEIGEDYFKINDAQMMENEEDGIEFTVNTNDIKILRYFKSGVLSVGDTAIVRYDGNIYADKPTVINGAYSINECWIVNGDSFIPE